MVGPTDDDLRHMLECEARYWKLEVRKRGRGWWNERKDKIKRKRGQAGLDALLAEMNKGR